MIRQWRVAVCLTLVLSSCTKWQVQGASPEQVVASEPSRAFLVKRKDGSQVQIREASVVSDSLVGVELEDVSGPAVGKRCAIALTDIASIAVRTRDKGASTVLWIALIVTVVGGILLGLSMQGMET